MGKVGFVAEYEQDGKRHTHVELSRFKRYQGRWVYVDGVITG